MRSPNSASPISRCRPPPSASGARSTATAAARSRPGEPRKAVGAPLLAADPVVDKEQACGVVFRFNGPQPQVIRSPVGFLPVGLEIVALRDVRSRAGRGFLEFAHCPADRIGVTAAFGEIGLVARQSGESRR